MIDPLAFAPIPETTSRAAVLVEAPATTPPGDLLDIRLIGAIDANGPVSSKILGEQLAELEANRVARLRVVIDSGGGSTVEAFAIYDRIRAFPGPVQTIAVNRCYSAAVVVLLAGAYRIAAPDAGFQIHQTSYTRDRFVGDNFNKTDLRRNVSELELVDNRTLDLLAARTGHCREWFADEIEDEGYLNSHEAQSCGLVHAIKGSDANSDWPNVVRSNSQRAQKIYLPRYCMTQSFMEACRVADQFRGLPDV